MLSLRTKIILTAIFTAVCLTAQCQFNIRAMRPSFDDRKIKGSHYLNEEFTQSAIHSNQTKQVGLMRYNIVDDIMEVKRETGLFALDPDIRVTKVLVDSTEFIVGKFEYKNRPYRGFLQVLDSGKVSLFAKLVVEFKEADQPAPMKYDLQPERYERADDILYYRIGSGEIMRVDKIKSFIESMPDKKAELNAFVKKEKISKDESDLIKLVNYYNSL